MYLPSVFKLSLFIARLQTNSLSFNLSKTKLFSIPSQLILFPKLSRISNSPKVNSSILLNGALSIFLRV